VGTQNSSSGAPYSAHVGFPFRHGPVPYYVREALSAPVILTFPMRHVSATRAMRTCHPLVLGAPPMSLLDPHIFATLMAPSHLNSDSRGDVEHTGLVVAHAEGQLLACNSSAESGTNELERLAEAVRDAQDHVASKRPVRSDSSSGNGLR